MTHRPAAGRRRAETRRPRRSLPGVAVLILTALVVGGLVGGLAGRTSRDHEVAHLRSDAAQQRTAAHDAERVAEDAATRAADADHQTYTATALAKHSAAGAYQAATLTHQAQARTAVCQTAMRTEMHDVTVLLDILNRDDAVYTVKRLKDVDADADGITSCLGPGATAPAPAAPTTPTPTTSPVLARNADR